MAALSLAISTPIGDWDCLRLFDCVVSSSADALEIASLSSNTYREKAKLDQHGNTCCVLMFIACFVWLYVSACAMLVFWREVS